MELGLTVRNHLINLNATQSFYDYVSLRECCAPRRCLLTIFFSFFFFTSQMQAALQLDWMDGAVKSYYTGNDFIVMSRSSNLTLRRMYVPVLRCSCFFTVLKVH
jgi:hypothetical protein